jgi:hypothetical protein
VLAGTPGSMRWRHSCLSCPTSMCAPRRKPTARFAALVSWGGGGFGHQWWRRGNPPEQQDRGSQTHRGKTIAAVNAAWNPSVSADSRSGPPVLLIETVVTPVPWAPPIWKGALLRAEARPDSCSATPARVATEAAT